MDVQRNSCLCARSESRVKQRWACSEPACAPRGECSAPCACRIVSASCVGEHECLVYGSSDVFTDACPGNDDGKVLEFGIM